MRYLGWVLKFALFVLVFSFAVKNTDTVAVRYYLDVEWQTPLIFVLLVAFCAGVAAGISACLGQLYRLRREIAALKGTPPAAGSGDAAAQKNELQV
jgi:lipopolysaccharide assembly protein A